MAYEYFGSPLKSDSIKLDPCFFGNISRDAAETLLKQRATCEGTYLVREGNDGFRLSVVDDASDGSFNVIHYKVEINCNQAYSIDPACSFSSMTSLVTYYKGKYTNMRKPLTVPCSHSFPPHKREENVHGSSDEFLSLYEISKDDITFKTQITVGKYNEVWKAAYKSADTTVSVKVSNDENNSDWYLMEEARALAALKHCNIINFIGLSRDHSVHLVLEFCCNKDLLDLLLRRDIYQVSKSDRLRMAQEVSEALLHISKLNYVHRNIKASNVLVNDNFTCKLAGFGFIAKMKEGAYVGNQADKPFNPNSIRWMALESAESKIFSTASDAWGFACLMIELFTDGEAPFSGTLTPNVITTMKSGFRPPKPGFLPKSLYAVMVKCWSPIPSLRPSFNDIKEHLSDMRLPAKPNVTRVQSSIASSPRKPKMLKLPTRVKSSQSFSHLRERIDSVMRINKTP